MGGEDPSTLFTNFYIYKYGGDQTTGKEVTGAYLINKDLNGGTLAFLEDRTIQFRTLGKYFTNEEGASMTIHNDGNVQAHKINTFISKDGTNKLVLADADGILKTSKQTYDQVAFKWWKGIDGRIYLTKLADGITNRPDNANIFIKDDGKVGVGTNPAIDFAVKNPYTGIVSTDEGVLLKTTQYNNRYAGISSVGAVVISADSNGSHKWSPNYQGFDGMIFNVSTEEVMRIHKNRYVGIGTNEPVQKLDVAGSIKISSTDNNCDATKAGTIRFNATEQKFQGCTGDTWVSLH